MTPVQRVALIIRSYFLCKVLWQLSPTAQRGCTDRQEKLSAARNKWGERTWRYECDSVELPVVLKPAKRKQLVTNIHCKLADIAPILCIVIIFISTPEQLYYINFEVHKHCVFVKSYLCRY